MEDSAFCRSLIIPTFSAQGHRVTAVENPLAALAMRQSGRMFDLILADIEMPEMDGIAFVTEVRAGGAWRNLPMIAFSGQNAPKGRTAGFDGHISKFDKAVLIEAVTEAFATHRETETLEAMS